MTRVLFAQVLYVPCLSLHKF